MTMMINNNKLQQNMMADEDNDSDGMWWQLATCLRQGFSFLFHIVSLFFTHYFQFLLLKISFMYWLATDNNNT